ncbi:hypothetical protein EDC94DRAFT_615380 [Helicostylum pulchrum]|nr:hypothetical protein EDC94DRAFT_615380 [Helicostylum pulchrum]
MIPLLFGLAFGAYCGAGVVNMMNDNTIIIKETTSTFTTRNNSGPAKPAVRQGQRQANGQAQRQAQRQEIGQAQPQGSARTQKRNAQRKRSNARKEQEAIESTAFTKTTNTYIYSRAKIVVVTPVVRNSSRRKNLALK